MDQAVARSLAKWPNVSAVYGWLSLDRRGNWRLKDERIGNSALRGFIARNYESDPQGRWYFQNGPQRVYVTLAYTPLVVHYEGHALFDHCGNPFAAGKCYQDEEGSVLISSKTTIALLDDRDLVRFAEQADCLPILNRAEVPARFGFVPDPAPAPA